MVASVVTVVAIPALWIMNGDSAKSTNPGVGSTVATPPPTTAYKPQTPVFVGGDDQAADQGGVININVAPAPSINTFRGRASYYRYPDTLTRPCTAPSVPDGTLITVTNVDNGQATTCTNILTITAKADAMRVDIIIHTDVFTEIGDFADAPIDVRVSW